MSGPLHSPRRWRTSTTLWVIALLVFLCPLIWSSLKQVELRNDVETWLPDDDPQARILSWYQHHFEHADTMLVTWEGSTLNDPRFDALRDNLLGDVDDETGETTGGSFGIRTVTTPRDAIGKMMDFGLPRELARERMQGLLIGSGLLNVRLTDEGRKHQEDVIADILARAEDELNLTLDVQPAVNEPEDWLQRRETDDDTSANSAENEFAAIDVNDPFDTLPAHDFRLHWTGIRADSETAADVIKLVESTQLPSGKAGDAPLVADAFFTSGSPVAAIVVLTPEGTADLTRTFHEFHLAVTEAGIPDDILHIGGSPVARRQLNHEVVSAGWNEDYPITQFHKRSPVLLSIIVGVVLAFFLLRSFRLAALVLLTSLFVALATVALVPPTGGSMNMVLIVMPNLLMVLTMSGAIHVANYWKHAAVRDLSTSVDTAVRLARQPCILASITTAIGLASLATSLLVPVRDFGIYSAIGCLISLFMVLYGLPAFMMLWPGRAPDDSHVDHHRWRALGRFLATHGTAVSIVCFAVFLFSCYGLRWFRTETKIIRYFPDHMRIIKDYDYLEENLAGIVPVDVVVRFDESARERLDVLQRMEIVRGLEQKIADYRDISGTMSLADFQPTLEPPADDAPFRVKARYNKTRYEMEDRLFEHPQPGASALATLVDEPIEVERDGEPVTFHNGDEIWRIRAQVAIMSELNYGSLTDDLDRILADAHADMPGVQHLVTGTVPLFLRTQQAVLESLIRSFALAFVMIALVMMVVLRSPLAGLITMLPNLLPVGVVFGIVSWLGVPVDIGTMITASVALGVAVDGTLHLLTWFRNGLREGMSRSEAIELGLSHCGPALWQTSAAVALGLLMLAGADLLLVKRFGLLMASLIAAALVADLVFLPALLGGVLGGIIERGIKVSDEPTKDSSFRTGVPAIAEPIAKR